MELAHEARDESATAVAETLGLRPEGRLLPPDRHSVRIDPETSTAHLRRCTALAARARVELLTPRRRTAAEELSEVLSVMEAWTPASLVDPDPTMTVLAAAALQDLAERLPETAELALRIPSVLDLLREVMAHRRIDVLA
jgi:hypothetical protein